MAIPIAGVAGIALDLVEHSVEPGGGGVVLVSLDEVMGGMPVAGESEIYGADEFGGWRVHG
jgi:hypothetical protein